MSICKYTVLLVFLLTIPTVLGFQAHATPEHTEASTELNIALENPDHDAVTLHLKHRADRNWTTYSSAADEITVPASHLKTPGLYDYYYTVGDSRATPTTTLTVTASNSPYEQNRNKSVTDFYTDDSFNCDPGTNETTCYYEHYQSGIISTLLIHAEETQNISMRQDALDLLESNWSKGTRPDDDNDFGCNPRNNDYSCETWRNFNVGLTQGSERQSRIIYSLWNAYRETGTEVLYDYAKNYTEGSAEDCDVWNNDYTCTEASDQAYMVLAYLEAYEATGADKYKNIASNLLSNVNTSIPAGFQAALKAEAVLDTAQASTLSEEALQSPASCQRNCSPTKKHHIVRGWRAHADNEEGTFNVTINGATHSITQRYRGLRQQFQPLRHHSNYTNPTPYGLSERVSVYRAAIATHPTNASKTSSIRLKKPASTNQPLIGQTSLYGNISKVNLTYENPAGNPSPTTVTTDRYGLFTIPSANTQSSKFLNITYDDRSQILSIPERNTNYENKLSNLLTDPRQYCSPYENNDNQCLYDYMQGSFTSGVYIAQLQLNETDNTVRDLITANIDPTIGRYSACDPHESDFSCENVAEDGFPDASNDEKGVYRAGQMIQGHVAAYRQTSNHTFLARATQYAYEDHEGCTDYSSTACDATAVASFLNGVVELYQIQQSSSLAKIRDALAESLHTQISKPSMKETPRGTLALLNHYKQTNNSTSLTKAKTYLDANTSICTVSGACNSTRLNLRTKGYWDLYNSVREATYYQQGNTLTDAQPNTEQNACNPNTQNPAATNQYSCDLPDQQGLILDTYATANRHYVLRNPANISVTMTADSTHDFGETSEVNCYAENIDDSQTVNLTGLQLLSDQTINNVSATGSASFTADTTEITVNDFAPGDYVNATFNLSYTRGGKDTLRCTILNKDTATPIQVTDIGKTSNTTQIRSDAYYDTDYTSKYSLTNNNTFTVQNITLNTSHKIQNATPPWNKRSNNTAFAPLWEEGQSSNVTLKHNPENEGQRNTTLTLSGLYGVEQNNSFTFTTRNNSLQRTTALPNLTLFEPKTYSAKATNNHANPVNLTIGTRHPSGIQVSLSHQNTTNTSFTTYLEPNQTVSYNKTVLVESSQQPQVTTTYTANGIQQSTTKTSSLNTNQITLNASDTQVPADGWYNHQATISNKANVSLRDASISISPEGKIDIEETELKPITVEKTEHRPLLSATTDNTSVTSNISTNDTKSISTDEAINLTFQAAPNIKSTSLTVTTNESFNVLLQTKGGGSTSCTIQAPIDQCTGLQTTTFQMNASEIIHVNSVNYTATYQETQKQGSDSPLKVSSLASGEQRIFTFNTSDHDDLPKDINLSAASREGATGTASITLTRQPSTGGGDGSGSGNEGQGGDDASSEGGDDASSGGGGSSGGGTVPSSESENKENETWIYTYTISADEMRQKANNALSSIQDVSERLTAEGEACFNITKSVTTSTPHSVTINYTSCLNADKAVIYDYLPDGLITDDTQDKFIKRNRSLNGSLSYQTEGSKQSREAFNMSPLILPGRLDKESDAGLPPIDPSNTEDNNTQTTGPNGTNETTQNVTKTSTNPDSQRPNPLIPTTLIYTGIGLIITAGSSYGFLRYARRRGKITEAEAEYLKAKEALAEEFKTHKDGKDRLTPVENAVLSMKLKIIKIENWIAAGKHAKAQQELQTYRSLVEERSDLLAKNTTKRAQKQLEDLAERTRDIVAELQDTTKVNEDENHQEAAQPNTGRESATTEQKEDEGPENPAPSLYLELKRAQVHSAEGAYDKSLAIIDNVVEEAGDMEKLYPEEASFVKERAENVRKQVKSARTNDTLYNVKNYLKSYREMVKEVSRSWIPWMS